MRKIMVGVVGVLAAMVGMAGQAQAVIDGETAKEQYSWIVDLGHQDNGHGCGGGLVAKQWVMTAGHCLGTVQKGSRVRVGSNDREDGGQMAAVAATFEGDYGDIGLIKLAEPVVGKAAMTVGKMPVNGPIRLLGWGMDRQEDPTSPRLLKQLDTEVLGQCGGDDEICVKASTEATACNGDSGTPAMVGEDVVAVTSRGPIGACGAEGSTIYTAIAPHKGWIDGTVAANQECAEQARP